MVGAEEPHWPPRSPFEAILSSPSGRKKVQQLQQQRQSLSPSPINRNRLGASAKLLQVPGQDEDEDDEDEETIQLKLQALEAKLKLKKLQNKKAREQTRANSATGLIAQDLSSRAPSVLTSRRDETLATAALHRSKSLGDVQVPLSPERRPNIPREQKSPGRVLLGIDKGLTAKDVSLRKAPSPRKPVSNADPLYTTTGKGLTRTGSISSRQLAARDIDTAPLSFNERMAQVRNKEKTDKERQERLNKLRTERSTGFDVSKEEIATFKEAAEGAMKATSRTESRSDQPSRSTGATLLKSKTLSSLRTEQSSRAPSTLGSSRPSSGATSYRSIDQTTASKESLTTSSEGDPALFEGFSKMNLSSRVLPHSFVARMVEDKTPVTLPCLLRDVKAPNFELPPELEDKDLVLFATIASKSQPRSHKQTHMSSKSDEQKTAKELADESEANENGKYMIFTLTDLKWSVELFLFKTAFTRWHKLQPGTVVAILNPSIMAPPKGRADTGRWSLTLNSSDDTVLEIGTSKDLGWCKAKTKDSRDCSDWIDRRKTEFCDFHVNRTVEGIRRGRMEVQGISAPFGPGGKSGGGSRYVNSLRGQQGQSDGKDDGLRKEGQQFDRYTQSQYFVVSRNATTASLLDADENGDLHGSREERQRQIFAAQEKERKLARELGRGGNGAGAEYLRARNGEVSKPSFKPASTAIGQENVNAKSLGLKSNIAANVTLSPLKRKSSIRAVSNGSSNHEPAGPARKKTRFITEKGIREAGRDSLGGEELTAKAMMHDDDDDELDIV